ncbi:hypothetical protein DWB61_02785 [Ancylomarina euxinus]|uniref:Uncharacterized protein n=1 Tax=Ancylomarina euxinus TaxID=2283627 RepID=A0A425Y6C4_9BACT|nr:hypothetical protein [Ancylomarina euxinus]MCZ4694071.1 hypothetical protein [Ancylomarina euxinus]MUP14509.1 hypothetical protein [Ancylomarina euxinus]RRG24059.1 hypothetical protein DWB61_02785 [Ancylomarina euxinus]
MIKLNEKIEDFLDGAKLLLNKSIMDSTIKSSVALLGYDEVKLTEAKSLLLILEELYDSSKKESTNQYQDEYWIKREAVNKDYLDLITISKIAFKNDLYAFQTLGLNNIRKKSFSGWFSQALEFCSTLISNLNYITSLEVFKQSIVEVQVIKEKILETKNFYKVYQGEIEAEWRTLQMQDEIFDLLAEWVCDYQKILRIALKDKPHLLETVGLAKNSFQECL